jgi:transcriptional regulator GlxA family with amidase domain
MKSKRTELPTFTICIPIYDGVDFMDVAGASELFHWYKEATKSTQHVKVYLVAKRKEKVEAITGAILYPNKSFKDLPAADLLWVPGGSSEALSGLMYGKKHYLNYLQQIAASAKWVTSVCEGALLLAQAGLLNGYQATTHWAFMNCLRQYPEITVVEEGHPRYVIDRNRITGAGISSGLDEALAIVQLLSGTEIAQSVQLTTQYFPKPPVMGTIPAAGDCPVKKPPLEEKGKKGSKS